MEPLKEAGPSSPRSLEPPVAGGDAWSTSPRRLQLDFVTSCPYGLARPPKPWMPAYDDVFTHLTKQLQEGNHGVVFKRGETTFSKSTRLFNKSIESPALITVCPHDTIGVSLTLRVAKEQGWSVSVKSGGFGTNGWAVGGDLVLDMKRMCAVEAHLPDEEGIVKPPPLQSCVSWVGERTVEKDTPPVHDDSLSTSTDQPLANGGMTSKRSAVEAFGDGSPDQGESQCAKRPPFQSLDSRDSSNSQEARLPVDVPTITTTAKAESSTSHVNCHVTELPATCANTPRQKSKVLGTVEAPGLEGIDDHRPSTEPDSSSHTPTTPNQSPSLTPIGPVDTQTSTLRLPELERGIAISGSRSEHHMLLGGENWAAFNDATGYSSRASSSSSAHSSGSQHASWAFFSRPTSWPIFGDVDNSNLHPYNREMPHDVSHGMVGVQPGPPALVTFGSGAKAKALDGKTASHGYHIPMSAYPVGSAIFATGGFGYMSRLKGLAMDNVVGVEMVLADGSIVRLGEGEMDPDEEKEWWWAFRGIGTTLGVITKLRCKAWKVGLVYAGNLIFPFNLATAASLIKHWRDCLKNSPPELYANLILSAGPNKMSHVIVIQLCYLGSEADGKRYTQALTSWEGEIPLLCDSSMCTYANQHDKVAQVLDTSYPHSDNRWCIRSDLMNSLPDDCITSTVQQFADIPERSAWIFEIAGKGVADVEESSTCFPIGHRRAPFTVAAIHQWRDEHKDVTWIAAAKQWIDVTISPHSPGGPYPCFLENRMEEGRIRGSFGSDQVWDRLTALKARYDPDLRFPYTLWPCQSL